MINGFFNAICRMGIFMVCAQAIVHFRPDGSYEKYLRMLVSVMILVQIFLPITRLFSSGVQQNMDDMVQELQRQMETGMEEAKAFSDASDGMLERMTLEEIKTQFNKIGFQGDATEEATGSAGQGSTARGVGFPESVLSAGSGTKTDGQDGMGRENAGQEDRVQESNGSAGGSRGCDISIAPVKIEIGGE